MNKLTPFLWFDNQMDEAIAFYSAIFPDAEVIEHEKLGDQVLSARFRLAGQEFMAMNAGPGHPFTDAFSSDRVDGRLRPRTCQARHGRDADPGQDRRRRTGARCGRIATRVVGGMG
jgi:hypothetical protein